MPVPTGRYVERGRSVAPGRRRWLGRAVSTGAAVALATAFTAQALAQAAQEPPRPRVSWLADGIVTGSGVALWLGASMLPVDQTGRWQNELFYFDHGTRGAFSASADGLSDALAMLTIALPVGLQVGQGFNQRTAERVLIYGETLSVTLAIGAVSKVLVARPRPYVYSSAPRVVAFTEREGKDSRLSFYSSHSAMAFAAGVSGSLLFTQTSHDRAARTAVWGTELFLAGLTAGLRVRAGRHFPSDVLVGTVVGIATGALIPYLHYTGQGMHSLSTEEAVAAGISPIAGMVASALWPCERAIVVPLEPTSSSRPSWRWTLAPWATQSGVGLASIGEF